MGLTLMRVELILRMVANAAPAPKMAPIPARRKPWRTNMPVRWSRSATEGYADSDFAGAL